MTPLRAAQTLEALLSEPPTVSPAPWGFLMRCALTEAVAALQRNDPFQTRDSAVLALSRDLSRAGAHAGWALAGACASERERATWMQCARWHQDAFTAIHAGWTRRPVLGSNRALPLEANQTALPPVPVQTTAFAQSWLTRLLDDPLQLSAADAGLGLRTIPGGAWIAP